MAKTPAQKAAINDREFAQLLNGTLRTVHFNLASLTVEGKAEDRRFVMEGLSGNHTLLVDATDLDRLNAHWTIFATHEANALAA